MPDTALLLWGVLFSSIGFGFFLYGKKQRMIMPFVSGIALFLAPYFLNSTLTLVLVGILLMAMPYFFRF